MEFILTFVILIFLAGFIFSRIIPFVMRLWIKRMQKKYNVKERPTKQKKRIDTSVGEYVHFEEIDIDRV